MMQAQNASLFLGLMPHPQSNQPEVNLDLARMFIDQLAMIQEKTRGNLSSEESNVLRNALSNLQMAFYEVAQGGGKIPQESIEPEPGPTPLEEPAAASPETPNQPASETPSQSAAENTGESKKRFSKSYGS